jgi:hypothetical protein
MYIYFLLVNILKNVRVYTLCDQGEWSPTEFSSGVEHLTVVVKTNIGRSLVRIQQFGIIVVNSNQNCTLVTIFSI